MTLRGRPRRAPRTRALALALVGAATTGAAGCGDERPTEQREISRYLSDRSYRRARLVAQLVRDDVPYARLRLARYDSDDERDWSRLEVFNPRVEPVHPRELAQPRGVSVNDPPSREARAIELTAAHAAADLAALRELGALAFRRYPAQLASTTLGYALGSRERAARAGLYVTEAGDHPSVNALVRVALPDGTGALALTCASCHSRANADGSLTLGAANASLDLGRAIAESPFSSDEFGERARAWGPGRVDVTTADASEPVAMPDLRAVRWQRFLNRAGAVAQRDLVDLAIRVETLLITSHRESVRPPREISAALAVYLYALGETPARNELATPDAREAQGRALFTRECSGCHAPPGFSGPLVPLETVQTEPSIARSIDRGTGMYRAPSLYRVSTRGPLLHDASAPSLEVLFDPARTTAEYPRRARSAGPIEGHRFGLALSTTEREALLAYLATL